MLDRREGHLSGYTFYERNGIAVAQSAKYNTLEGPGIRSVLTDEHDRVTHRLSKRALGARYYMDGNTEFVDDTWLGVNAGETVVWNFGGVSTATVASVAALQVDVAGVWLLQGNVTMETGLIDSYIAVGTDNTTRYGAGQPNLAQQGSFTSIVDTNIRFTISCLAYLDAGDGWNLYLFHSGLGGTADATITGTSSATWMACEYLGEPDQATGYTVSAKNPTL